MVYFNQNQNPTTNCPMNYSYEKPIVKEPLEAARTAPYSFTVKSKPKYCVS